MPVATAVASPMIPVHDLLFLPRQEIAKGDLKRLQRHAVAVSPA